MNIAFRAVNRLLRKILERNGYWVRHSSVLPLGTEVQFDVQQLSQKLNVPIRTFFDVGANIGQTSSAALENFGEAKVFAFEPHRATFEALSSNVRDPRFKAFNLALSDQEGPAPFFDYGSQSCGHSLVENAPYAVRTNAPSKTVTVERSTLDGFCDTHGIAQIDVLKVDTEGHDLTVLQGAKGMLGSGRIKFVYVEFNTILPKSDASGGALSAIAALLEPLGFTFVASYPVYSITEGDLFFALDALFVRTSNEAAKSN